MSNEDKETGLTRREFVGGASAVIGLMAMAGAAEVAAAANDPLALTATAKLSQPLTDELRQSVREDFPELVTETWISQDLRDKAVEAMAVGEEKTVNIQPEDAYGSRNDQMIQEVPKGALPDGLEPEVGMGLQARGQGGQVINLTVTAVGDDSITVDGNHPLAGQNLNFDIQLVDIG